MSALPSRAFSVVAEVRRVALARPTTSVLVLLSLLTLIEAGRGAFRVEFTDFQAYWEAGRAFTAGQCLYFTEPGQLYYTAHGRTHPFIYPLFAAWVFSPLGALPLAVAGAIFGALGVWVYAASLWMMWIAMGRLVSQERAPMLLAIGIVTGFQFVLFNQNLLQANLWLLLALTAGFAAWLTGRPWLSAIVWTLGAAFKLLLAPLVLWGWLRGGWGFRVAMVLTFLVTLAAPIMVRGWDRGLQDWREYTVNFLAPTAAGDTPHHLNNVALIETLLRMSNAKHQPPQGDYRVVDLPRWIPLVLGYGLILMVLVMWLQLLSAPRTAGVRGLSAEWAATTLLCHAASPKVWPHHLVTLTAVAILLWIAAPSRVWRVVLGCVLLFLAIPHQTLLGRSLGRLMYGDGAITLALWLLLAAALGWTLYYQRRPEGDPVGKSGETA